MIGLLLLLLNCYELLLVLLSLVTKLYSLMFKTRDYQHMGLLKC